VVLMFHTLRGLYDYLRRGQQPWSASSGDPAVRELLAAGARPPERGALPEVFGAASVTWSPARGADHPVLRFPGTLARELVHYLDRVGLDPRR